MRDNLIPMLDKTNVHSVIKPNPLVLGIAIHISYS